MEKSYCGKVVNLNDYERGSKLGERKIKDVLSYPHFPLSNRDPDPVYKPKKLIRSYTDADLKNIPNRVQERLRDKLSDFRPESRFDSSSQVNELNKYRVKASKQYSLQKSASFCEKVRVEVKGKRSKITAMPSYEYAYDPDIDEKVNWSLRKLKKHIRGKSADGIKNVLLKDVEDNIIKGVDYQQMDMQAFQGMQQGMVQRKKVYTVIDASMAKDIETSVMKPLQELKTQLKSFAHQESSYIESRRCDV